MPPPWLSSWSTPVSAVATFPVKEQELTDVFDFGFGPRVHDIAANCDNFRRRYLLYCNVITQGLDPNS